MTVTVVKKRGRPKGSKKKRAIEKPATHITIPMQDGQRKYAYTFRSSKCNCIFQSDIRGSGMFCIHRHSMDIITSNE